LTVVGHRAHERAEALEAQLAEVGWRATVILLNSATYVVRAQPN
jgi:hypothetical protein